MTLHELKEKYPELYSEIVESTTKDVTDKVTAEVTITVTEAVTAKVTAEVTEAVALATKITLEKEFAEAQVKKESDGATSIEESQKKITGLEEEIAGLKTNVQPYVDILEGLVTYMREKGLLISEDEIISIKTELETPATEVTEEAKKLAEEMTAVINEQKAKLDEALARISALEDEKKVLEDAKAIAESEKQKAELSATITEILTKEAKYAPILKAKLESATTIEQVNQIYEQEKEFIATIEKLNASTEIPAGTGTVVEAEKIVETTIGETVLTESMTSDDKLKALKDYQRKLAGF